MIPLGTPCAGDVGSVFKERLIDSFGQLPTAHAPTHMVRVGKGRSELWCKMDPGA